MTNLPPEQDKTEGVKTARPQTRIQREKTGAILDGALEVFSRHGFRGATIDQIAGEIGISKPNLLYYFPSKEAMHSALLERLLETWLAPLAALDPNGEPLEEVMGYVQRKLEMARDFPRESRLFANEILQGAPRIQEAIEGPLKSLVDETCLVLRSWMDEGRLAKVDPHHLIFAIWATTQHYADFDAQVQGVLGARSSTRFDDASDLLQQLFVNGLRP